MSSPQIHVCPEHQNVPSLRNGVCANVAKLRSYRITRGQNLMVGVLTGQERFRPYKKGEGHAAKVERRVMWPHGNGHLGHQKPEEARKDSARESPEGAGPCHSFASDVRPPEHISLLKPCGWWTLL